MDISGLLYSQIGYDLKDPKRALIRSTDKEYVPEGSRFEIADSQFGECVFDGEVKYWGEIWKSHWWEIDFSTLDLEGEYSILVKGWKGQICSSDSFKIAENLLWKETIRPVALEQLEERAARARNRNGWKDCGSTWREVNSHASMVIALTDLFFFMFENFSESENLRIAQQIITGCDYIAICQDKAKRMGLPEGAIIHEIPNHLHVIPGDVAKSTVAFARASRMLADINPQKSDEYLERAVKAYAYMLKKAEPFGSEGFSYSNHGAPADFNVPGEWMTRDLIMMVWGGLELWINGIKHCKDDAVRIARLVMKRQVPKDKREREFYGHFYTFDHCSFTEKANTHHHFGHDSGSTFPHYLIPFMEMAGRWYDHPDVALWKKTVHDFAYGYYLPACSKNPFHIIPEGYFQGQGLLVFCGPWHGINTSICFGAALAVKLEGFTGDREFRKIAVGNIQWIAGLNSGITNESFKGCVFWKDEIPDGKAEPFSQIHGIGRRSVGCWTDIKGTIPNGFNVNPQFQLVVEPTLENDGPWLYTDEDWIPHAAGWITALTYLKESKRYSD